MEDLAVEVGEVNGIGIDESDFSDASGGEVDGGGGAETAGSDDEDGGVFEAELSLRSDFGNDEVTGVA